MYANNQKSPCNFSHHSMDLQNKFEKKYLDMMYNLQNSDLEQNSLIIYAGYYPLRVKIELLSIYTSEISYYKDIKKAES